MMAAYKVKKSKKMKFHPVLHPQPPSDSEEDNKLFRFDTDLMQDEQKFDDEGNSLEQEKNRFRTMTGRLQKQDSMAESEIMPCSEV